ncbi:ganglioside-induced differentiation-associated protein 1-like [Gigantopelta aegis]|uniref:ganglioside-induced differentiation-associated protein 1-like n=1 Tax=Gigantopelta aegis TaxID=1735272 RepID=UPI001B88789A|nr:ganglioside-induced differentiation-associated protein 1-like [Gigantopelta aegis]
MDHTRFTLYYFPVSYCSQKVFIALKEKNAEFQKRNVDLLKLEQMEAWFMRINPRGEVPVLKDGEKIVLDSEDIIDYIDKEIHADIRLVPGTESEYGKQVAKFRKLLLEFSPELLTFGTMFHPELTPENTRGATLLKMDAKAFKERALRSLTNLSTLAENHPDLHQAYMAKARDTSDKLEKVQDKEKIQSNLTKLDSIFDRLEVQLRQMKIEVCDDSWLCGPEFSAADISLAVLLGRISYMGLETTFFPHERRPNVQAYWKRVLQHKNCSEVIGSYQDYALKDYNKNSNIILPVAGGVAVCGLAIGVATFLYNKRS